MKEEWFVYILRSEKSGRTYVGVAKDTERRLMEHNGELPRGAKATRPWRPWKLWRILGPYENRSKAQEIEAKIKRLRGRLRLDYQQDGVT